jgi:hypothetical protein
MLKLSKEGMTDEAEVINQMLMPLHERYSTQCVIVTDNVYRLFTLFANDILSILVSSK